MSSASSSTTVKKRPIEKRTIEKFFKGFSLWLLCIPINVVPVILPYFNDIQPHKYSTITALLADAEKDPNFLFIFVAMLFVLPLQGLFADYTDDYFQKSGRVCSVVCYMGSVFLLCAYVLCSSNYQAASLIYTPICCWLNYVVAGFTIVAGIAIHLLISLDKH